MAKTNNNPFEHVDISKMFSDFNVPGVDWQEVMASQQKNIAALTEANQRLVDGAQAVVQQQSQIMSKAMSELSAATPGADEGRRSCRLNAQKRFDLAKSSFESGGRQHAGAGGTGGPVQQ